MRADGDVDEISYGWLRETSNRLANALRGARRRARRPGRDPAAAGAGSRGRHIAIYKLGAVALPLAMLFGVEAISLSAAEFRRAKALITNAQGLAKLAEIAPTRCRPRAGALDRRRGRRRARLSQTLLARASADFTPVDTAADDPAMMIYTSGTTGQPKGALHAHRVLLGHLPGIELPHDFLPQPGDRFWTPADWAWAGGLLDVLLPSLHHGVPVVARAVREIRSARRPSR